MKKSLVGILFLLSLTSGNSCISQNKIKPNYDEINYYCSQYGITQKECEREVIKHKHPTSKSIKKRLGVSSKREIFPLPGNYCTDSIGKKYLEQAINILKDPTFVTVEGNDTIINGTPESIYYTLIYAENILPLADKIYSDKVITSQEAKMYLDGVLKKRARKFY